MTDKPDCDKPVVWILKFQILLDEWIADGPGPHKYLYSPGRYIYCADTDPYRIIGELPLLYRNNELVFFLIACGILTYPWSYMPSGLKQFVSEVQVDSDYGTQIHRDNERTYIEFAGNDVYPNLQFKLLSGWETRLFDIFGFVRPIVSTKLADLPTLIKSEDFVMSVAVSPQLTATLANYVDAFIPDRTFADTITMGSVEELSNDNLFVIADSPKFNCSIIVFVMLLPGEMVRGSRFASMIRLFAVVKLHQGRDFLEHLVQHVVLGNLASKQNVLRRS